jgi:hypothetical protein
MAGSSRFPMHLVPDDGTRYAPGEIVHLDQSTGRVQIVVDPEGTYVVVNCRPATEYTDAQLLRVDLKRREAPPTAPPDPWAPRSRYDR